MFVADPRFSGSIAQRQMGCVEEQYDLLFMNPGGLPGSDWRYVMGRNWDPSQNINTYSGRVEWPQGPLTFEHSSAIPKWVEAWVVQISTGASQRTAQNSGWAPDRWTADGIPPGWINGSFQSGLATGVALAAWQDSTGNHFEWWVEMVYLY